jgi:hypothetical protein
VVSPGRGGFQRGFVFAVQQQTIYKIPPTGGTAVPFVTIASLENSETSMTFDTVGSFGFALIVTDRLGEIWKVTSGGVATMITDVGHQTEGPAVAPMTFAPFGGQILVTDDFENAVFAVSATGVETPVATYPAAESVVFMPRNVCEFGSTGGAFFVASQFGNTVYKFPAGDFAGLNTRTALVLTKGGTIGKLVSVGGSVQVSDFESDPSPRSWRVGRSTPVCRAVVRFLTKREPGFTMAARERPRAVPPPPVGPPLPGW